MTFRPIYFALTILSLAAFTQDAAPVVDGYGQWRFGMTREEVSAVAEHGPYKPVQSTGGLETANGVFEGETMPVSFVFTPDGALDYIQVWAYSGDSYDAAVAAFHRVYAHIDERFGRTGLQGLILSRGMTVEELADAMPEPVRPTGEDLDPEAAVKAGNLSVRPVQAFLRPVLPVPGGARVFASFSRVHPLKTFLVMLYYRQPESGAR